MINTHWGGVTENNHFGTHEFLDLCEQLGCEPYICGNVGSGTVREMQQWVEYITSDGVSPMTDLRKKNGRDEPWKLTYFGVGNENWGCGGSMTPEFYADQYRRYATYVRNFGDNRIFKIACGPNGGDYQVDRGPDDAGGPADGRPGTSLLLRHGRQEPLRDQLRRGRLVRPAPAKRSGWRNWSPSTREIMDRYDPQKRVALIVDEWGAWHQVEPGTNPGFLYQQNTLRDALVAGVTLNIFNRHCDRVRMANIAQTVNVLQAMILTDKEKMLLTPTYHVFEMYTVHHDATLLPTDLNCDDYQFAQKKIPALSVSASRDKAGKIHVTLCNLNPNEPAEVQCALEGASAKAISGRVLTATEMQAHNTFDSPESIAPVEFRNFERTNTGFTTTLPAKSVVHIPFSFPLERTIQHNIEDKVRLPMGRYLGEVAQPGATMASESAGYVSYYSNADLYDFPGLTSPAAVEALESPEPHLLGIYGIAQLLHPDFLILRPNEAEILKTDDPDTFAEYRLLRTFGLGGR